MKFLAILLLVSCTRTQTIPPPPPQPEGVPGPQVIFPNGFTVDVEIVADDELRAQGLMYRDHLRPGAGMLFFFLEEEEHGFWMKNTLIPLDMIWIDRNRKIVHIKNDVPPCRVPICPSYTPGVPSLYVLEVAAGVAKQQGLEVGDELQFVRTENVRVQ